MQYHISKTQVSDEAMDKLATKYGIKAWTKAGAPRWYLNNDALNEVIGLDQDFYGSGNVRSCGYVNADGEYESVANSRAYGRSYNKTFIRDGKVMTTWSPYRDGDEIAELVATRINELFA